MTRTFCCLAVLFGLVLAEYTGGLGPREAPSKPEVQTRYVDRLTRNHVDNSPTTPKTPFAPQPYSGVPRRDTVYLTNNGNGNPQATHRVVGVDLSQHNNDPRDPFAQRNKLFQRPQPREQQPPNDMTQSRQFIPSTYGAATNNNYMGSGYPQQIPPQSQIPPQTPQSAPSPNVDVGIQRGSQMSIAGFSTNVGRFATDHAQGNRVVLPVDFANTPIESFMKKAVRPSAPQRTVQVQPVGANSRLLTNPDLEDGSAPVTARPFPAPGHRVSNDGNYTLYPNPRDGLFPKLQNFWHEDRRPATGDRLGHQGRFGGGTNEYKEDQGQVSDRSKDINDRRMSWEAGPGSLVPTEAPREPLNKYFKNVAIETHRYPSPEQPAKPKYGDDRTQSDVLGGLPMNRYGKEFAELTTPFPLPTERSAYIGVPLYPEFTTGNDARKDSMPFSGAISSPHDQSQSRIALGSPPTTPEILQPGIRPYYGPEEITRSRFKNFDADDDLIANRHRHVKIDLLNE